MALGGIISAAMCSEEIWLSIAQYLVREYLTIQALALINMRNSETWCVTISKPIRYWTTHVDGVSYISSMTNDHSDGRLVTTLNANTSTNVLYIAEDYIGITQIAFGNASTVPEVDGVEGRWWRTLEVAQNAHLIGKTNVGEFCQTRRDYLPD